MADGIRFHERLLRLSDWIDGDPNIDEDLWPIPKQALDEIERLRAELQQVANERALAESKEARRG